VSDILLGMKRAKKKTPADYPQLTFRLPNEEARHRLDILITKIQDAFNADRKDGEKVVRRNDVILAALEKGLKLLRK
jgi:hypothetical protein